MDWYYPVLAGALTGEAAKARLAEGWDTFVMDGSAFAACRMNRGSQHRKLPSAPWPTRRSVTSIRPPILLRWTRSHRLEDGSYLTGIVYPSLVTFPDQERSAYTGAAVILAADAISGASPASRLFIPLALVTED